MLSHLWITLSLMKAAPKSHKRECEFWRKHAIVYYCYTLSWNFRDNLVRFWRKSLSLHLKMFQLWAGYNPPKFLVNCYFHSSWTLSWKFKEVFWKKWHLWCYHLTSSTLWVKMYEEFVKQTAFAKVATFLSVTRLESEFDENCPEIARKGMWILKKHSIVY